MGSPEKLLSVSKSVECSLTGVSLRLDKLTDRRLRCASFSKGTQKGSTPGRHALLGQRPDASYLQKNAFVKLSYVLSEESAERPMEP